MTTDRDLERALAAWAKETPRAAGDDAALLRILQHADAIATSEPRVSHRKWWVGGGFAVAASIAIALLLSPGLPGPGSTAPAVGVGDGSVMLAQANADESAAFALLYTPTSEEEYQL